MEGLGEFTFKKNGHMTQEKFLMATNKGIKNAEFYADSKSVKIGLQKIFLKKEKQLNKVC